MRQILSILDEMKNKTSYNCIVEGLNSSLIGGGGHGGVRLFEQSRNQIKQITPHNHRFDFTCLVLSGHVVNHLWRESKNGDEYQSSSLTYLGRPGSYTKEAGVVSSFSKFSKKYVEGDWYSMKAHELHSIEFSKGAKVLFFEGKEVTKTTQVIEPYVNKQLIPTLLTEDWMFLSSIKSDNNSAV